MSINAHGQTSSEQPGVIVLDSRAAQLERLDEEAPPITTNPRRLSGAPVIGIQRMPVTTLLDYLIEGYSIRREIILRLRPIRNYDMCPLTVDEYYF